MAGSTHGQVGKIIVNSDLSVPGHPEIFAIGNLPQPRAPDSRIRLDSNTIIDG